MIGRIAAFAIAMSLILPSAATAGPGRAERQSAGLRSPLVVFGSRPRYVRPAARPNASDVKLFPYTPPPGSSFPIVPCFVFDPSGSLWMVDGDDYVERFDTNGTQTRLNVPRATPFGLVSSLGLTYADGFMWFDAVGGFERLKLGGSGRRFFQTSGNAADVVGAGAAGSIWLVVPDKPGYAIERVSNTLSVTRYPIETPGIPAYFQVGPDGLVYFEYGYRLSSGALVTGVSRMNTDGSETHYPGVNFYEDAFANGGLYYLIGGSGPQPLVLAFLSFSTGKTTLTPLDGFTDGDIYSMQAAPDGTLWFTGLVGPAGGDTHEELFSYDPIMNRVSGPYESSILNELGSPLAVDSDGNVYVFASIGKHEFVGRYAPADALRSADARRSR